MIAEIIDRGWRSSVVEQLICNQQVGGSSPFASSTKKRIIDCGIKEILATEVTENMEKDYFNESFINSVFSVAKKVSVSVGEVAEWTKAADCKSAGASLRRFESCPPHHVVLVSLINSHKCARINTNFLFAKICVNSWLNANSEFVFAGVAQLARASAFQAEGRGFESRLPLNNWAHVAQSVEHILGKDEVGGSSPLVGSSFLLPLM